MAKQQNGIDENDQGSTTPDYPVMIGVVASAGGLAALKALCGELDQLVGASVMITQHISPTHHSQLPELLAACTECKVETAKTGVRPAAGTIYVVPPDRDAVFQSGVIRLRKPDPDTTAHPSGDRLLVSIVPTPASFQKTKVRVRGLTQNGHVLATTHRPVRASHWRRGGTGPVASHRVGRRGRPGDRWR